MNLQLSLKRKWFEMTDKGTKPEDYREITPYWLARLFHYEGIDDLNAYDFCEGLKEDDPLVLLHHHTFSKKEFTQNTTTLGYPKKGDKERIRIYEHKGIEIRTGNPEWGAEEDKLYFVIKHGNKIEL